MTIREKYEYLKSDLMVRLTDATVMCELSFPFDFTISKDEENRYFIRGAKTRLALKKAMIIIDNTYQKIRLFPSEENAQEFKEALDDILKDVKDTVIKAFINEEWRFRHDDLESYTEYIDSLIAGFREASVPFIEKLKELTQDDILAEIEAEDNLKKLENSMPMHKNETPSKKNLFQ
ncbi:MAG: hypothetical protein LUE64_05735 [Candidatus Gastranaerophilales bacterium]|nr:hypothetical protein [Candidatus Gastranaerophilales bacterium]